MIESLQEKWSIFPKQRMIYVPIDSNSISGSLGMNRHIINIFKKITYIDILVYHRHKNKVALEVVRLTKAVSSCWNFEAKGAPKLPTG